MSSVQIRRFTVVTPSKTAIVDVTHLVRQAVEQSGISDGLCVVYVPHTTCGVVINENADPDVRSDLMLALETLVPNLHTYRHAEGNSPAHIKTALVGVSQCIPVEKGNLCLGTWQGVFLCEFDGPRSRNLVVQLIAASSGPT